MQNCTVIEGNTSLNDRSSDTVLNVACNTFDEICFKASINVIPNLLRPPTSPTFHFFI